MMMMRPYVALGLAGLAGACMTAGLAPADSVSQHLAVAQDVASQVSGKAHELMSLVHGSELGARYGMLNPLDPRTSEPTYRSIRAAEMLAREELAARIRSDSRIDLAFLAYGEFVLFVERRFKTEEERQDWLESSGGDMYAGPFVRYESDDPCEFGADEEVPHVSQQAAGVLIGVPICYEGRYVCALYLRISTRGER